MINYGISNVIFTYRKLYRERNFFFGKTINTKNQVHTEHVWRIPSGTVGNLLWRPQLLCVTTVGTVWVTQTLNRGRVNSRACVSAQQFRAIERRKLLLNGKTNNITINWVIVHRLPTCRSALDACRPLKKPTTIIHSRENGIMPQLSRQWPCPPSVNRSDSSSGHAYFYRFVVLFLNTTPVCRRTWRQQSDQLAALRPFPPFCFTRRLSFSPVGNKLTTNPVRERDKWRLPFASF